MVEAQYGETVEVTPRTVAVGDEEIHADVLRIGRLALFWRSPDGSRVGTWDPAVGAWIELDGGARIIGRAMEMATAHAPGRADRPAAGPHRPEDGPMKRITATLALIAVPGPRRCRRGPGPARRLPPGRRGPARGGRTRRPRRGGDPGRPRAPAARRHPPGSTSRPPSKRKLADLRRPPDATRTPCARSSRRSGPAASWTSRRSPATCAWPPATSRPWCGSRPSRRSLPGRVEHVSPLLDTGYFPDIDDICGLVRVLMDEIAPVGPGGRARGGLHRARRHRDHAARC